MKKVFSLKKFLLSAFEMKIPMETTITSLRYWALDCEGLTVAEMEAQGLTCSDAWLQVVEE